jgi:hypothetical protein
MGYAWKDTDDQDQDAKRGPLNCHNKLPEAGQLMNNRDLFLLVLKAVKFKIKVQVDTESGQRQFSGAGMSVCSPCPHMAERAGEVSQASFTTAPTHLRPLLRA